MTLDSSVSRGRGEIVHGVGVSGTLRWVSIARHTLINNARYYNYYNGWGWDGYQQWNGYRGGRGGCMPGRGNGAGRGSLKGINRGGCMPGRGNGAGRGSLKG